MYPTVEKFVASELKKVFTEAFISRIFELVKYDVSLLNEFNWYALSASYVALFNFESYCDCKLNVSTLFCVYVDSTKDIGKINIINITAKLCIFIIFSFRFCLVSILK